MRFTFSDKKKNKSLEEKIEKEQKNNNSNDRLSPCLYICNSIKFQMLGIGDTKIGKKTKQSGEFRINFLIRTQDSIFRGSLGCKDM